jgi:hypothetical protein
LVDRAALHRRGYGSMQTVWLCASVE